MTQRISLLLGFAAVVTLSSAWNDDLSPQFAAKKDGKACVVPTDVSNRGLKQAKQLADAKNTVRKLAVSKQSAKLFIAMQLQPP